MTASRIIVEGDAIEIAGRFTSEAELDAFIERVWTVFFAMHPPAEDGENGAAAPINLPSLIKGPTPPVFAEPASADISTPSRPAVMAGFDQVIHDSAPQRPGANVQHKAGRDKAEKDAAERAPEGDSDDEPAFARLSPSERRCVMLWRKHRNAADVAKIMEISPNSVSVYLSTARRKGVTA